MIDINYYNNIKKNQILIQSLIEKNINTIVSIKRK